QVAKTSYDSIGRPQQALAPLGGGSWIDYPNATQVNSFATITQSGPASGCAGCGETQTTMDNLGRASLRTLVNDPDGATNTKTTYDTSGRVAYVSNPYRGSSDSGGETFTYDALDHVAAVTHVDGSVAHSYF